VVIFVSPDASNADGLGARKVRWTVRLA